MINEARPPMKSDLKLLAFLKCLIVGHEFQNSRSHPGMQTCRRCKFRK